MRRASLEERRLAARAAEQARACVRETAPLDRVLMRAGQHPAAVSPALDEAGWIAAPAGARWGGEQPWAWFRIWFRVPTSWAGARVRLAIPLGGQGMAYLDGVPWQGLDENHRGIFLPASCHDGQPHLIAVECYAVGGTTVARRPDEACTLGACRLELLDAAAEAFYYDLLVGVEVLGVLPVSAPERAPLLTLLLEAENRVDRRRLDGEAFFCSVAEARALLTAGLADLAAGSAANRPLVRAVGHAHIDTAWLWPLAQTRRKVARSWSTALRLMERHPSFHFLCSQPQQYRWLEEDEPALYRQVVERIREGRWEPAGAMWVEPDSMLTAGESLVRQFLYGQRFLRERFGRPCGILWLPDAFGYTAALPQLMRGAGVHTFVTIKLSWNDTNRMPHDTFRWRGLDGSEVLGYFMTAGPDWEPLDLAVDPGQAPREAATYNGDMSAAQVLGSWVRYRDKDLNDQTLYAYGWGDGGGGPTERMLEYLERLGDYPGMPRVETGSAEEFFKALHDRVWANPRTPVWEGELYLEYHRGTYTSQARVKWDNRRSEGLLREADLWCAWAAALGRAEDGWQARLRACWETVLLNQFHDILPGSSIGEVYADQRRQHAEVAATASAVLAEAQERIGGAIGAQGQALALFNAGPWPRTETLEIALPEGLATTERLQLADEQGASLATQEVEATDGERRLLLAGASLPANGYASFHIASGKVGAPPELAVTERRLENQCFRLDLDEHGRFASLFDKRHGREVLAPGGGGNQLLAFEDKPITYDAWDIDRYYVEKCRPIDAVAAWQVVERGPLRAGVEIARHWDGSTIRQRIFLYADTPLVEVRTFIDWRHRQVLLKAAFPLAVHAGQASYECAFGYVQRPTHRNTSWDAARFEVAAHRWADLAENGYGVSLLNDGKYGHDCLGNVLRLTLLKSAIEPDPRADEGEHRFAYALFPHGPDWRLEDTVRAAHNFNLPVRARVAPGGGSLPWSAALVSSDSPHAVVDTIKPAEDGDGLIVRVYDCANRRGPVTLTFAQAIADAAPVTILEEPDPAASQVRVDGRTLTFDLLPFQVRSFRVRFAAP